MSAHLRPAGALILALAVSASGCGTAFNISREFGTPAGPPPEFYGGVRFEYHFITTPQEPPFDVRFLFLPFVLVDLPLSAVFDTITLPWVAGRRLIANPPAAGSGAPDSGPLPPIVSR